MTSHTSSQPDVGKRMSNTSHLTTVAISGHQRRRQMSEISAGDSQSILLLSLNTRQLLPRAESGGSFKANQPHRRSRRKVRLSQSQRDYWWGFSIDAYKLCKSHPLYIRPSKVLWYTMWHKLWRGRRQCLMKTNTGFIPKVKGVFVLFKQRHSS